MDSTGKLLFCFAVKEEAAPFQRLTKGRSDVEILVTGMGQANAERAISTALEKGRPRLVITSGFAGGLNPDLPPLTVVFDLDESLAAFENALARLGHRKSKFLCADRVLATVEAKRAARAESGADLVEMESGVIRRVCRERGVPGATVRVVSDAAGEPLPLDFGALMTADCRMDFGKLAVALAKSPGKIPELMRFRGRIVQAGERLAAALAGMVD